jgi:hypothetical protein
MKDNNREKNSNQNAITMAEYLKDESSLQKKAKLGDGSKHYSRR